MKSMQIGTSTSKSTRFVNLQPSTTFWMFFFCKMVMDHIQDLSIVHHFGVFILAEFDLTTTKMLSDLTVVFSFAVVF